MFNLKKSLIFTFLFLLTTIVNATDPKTIVVSFQKQKNPEELQKTANVVAEFLAQEIGMKVEVLIPTSYGVTAQGLISKKVHVAYMDSLPFILAAKETPLEILAVENRNHKTNYDSLIVVGANSNIKSLKDLKGKSIAFSSQTSTSGYLFPFSRLLTEKEIATPKDLQSYFSKIIYAGGYDKALLAVANEQADAAALSDYAFEGPKADIYVDSATRAKLKVLTRTPGVPTHLITASKDLSEGLRIKIQNALLKISKTKPELLASVYGAAELVKPTANHVENTQAALKITGLEVNSFVK